MKIKKQRWNDLDLFMFYFFAFKVVGSDISSRLSRIPVFSEVMMK